MRFVFFLLFACSSLQAQTLPKVAKEVFRCHVNGKVVYSDQPCLGAKRIDLEPTRGVNRLKGSEVTGPDVANEKFQESMAEAMKPLTGTSADDFKKLTRRHELTPQIQSECKRLDVDIRLQEAAERTAASRGADALKAAQLKLFESRTRYREIRC